MQYDAAGLLPTDSGAVVYSDGSTSSMAGFGEYQRSGVCSVDANYLYINTSTQNLDSSGYFENPTTIQNMDLNSTAGYSIEWRLKILNIDTEDNNDSVQLSCGVSGENAFWSVFIEKANGKLYAHQNYIGTYGPGKGGRVLIDIDASNPAFHTLRVTAYNGIATLYVDGLFASQAAFRPGVSSPIRFGDQTDTADASIIVDYLYAYDDGAIAPYMYSQRQLAKERRRRIILNNDGDDVVYYTYHPTEQALLDVWTTQLPGSQVDTLFYCTWSAGFSFFTHNTQIGEVFNSTDPFSNNKTQAFIDQGTDALEIVTNYCRQNDIEIFWSFRMNDIHDYSMPDLFPQLKTDHPEYLMGHGVSYGYWSAVDYTRSEIRDLAFQFTEEVCQNYDIDGVELDFFRHPTFFRSMAYGAHPSEEELEMMTDMIRKIRLAAEIEGAKRGRPILIAARVPDSISYSRLLGLDIEKWMEEDLIDIYISTGLFRLNEWEYSIDLGHQYGLKVYAGLSESRLNDQQSKTIRQSYEGYRGRASQALGAGADGIYLFNYQYWFTRQPSAPQLLYQLGSFETLAEKDRVYTTTSRGWGGVGTYGAESFMNRTFPTSYRPFVLTPDVPRQLDLYTGQQLATEGQNGLYPPDVELELWTLDPIVPASLLVTLNGHSLLCDDYNGTVLKYTVEPGWVDQGLNEIELRLRPDAQPCSIIDLLLWVRFAPCAIDADIDDNCWVDFRDFSIAGSQWRDVPAEPSADIASAGGDGIVDTKDIAALLEWWLWEPVEIEDHFKDSFEGNFDKWTDGGITNWDKTGDQQYSGSDAQYFHENFRIKFDGSNIIHKDLWIDDVKVVVNP